MKRIFYSLAIIFLLFSCQGLEEEKHLPQAEVSFSTLSLQQFNMQSEQARTQASAWKHVFAEEVEMLITNNESGEAFTLVFDPNDFFLPKTIMLPYGEYTYMVESAGEEEEFSSYLPFTASGSFLVSSPNLNISLNAETTFGLVSVKNEYVESVIIANEPLRFTVDDSFFYLYLSSGTIRNLRIETGSGETFEREVVVNPYSHLNYYLVPMSETTSVMHLEMGNFEYIPEGIALEQINHIVYDLDGNRYRTVSIGNQVWMAENLRASTFCNGDPIPHVPGVLEDWIGREEPMWTFYENDEKNDYPYGKLYNGFVALDERNPCPCDFRIPTQEDFEELLNYASELDESKGNLKTAGFDYWIAPNGSATNTTNFSIVGSGIFVSMLQEGRERGVHNPSNFPNFQEGFNAINMSSGFWTTTWTSYVINNVTFEEVNTLNILFAGYQTYVIDHWPNLRPHDGQLQEGLSIRCIQNLSGGVE